MTPLSFQQARVLQFARLYVSEHECFPSVREIASALDYRSPGPALKLLNELVDKGALRRPDPDRRRWRALEIVSQQCPHCGGQL